MATPAVLDLDRLLAPTPGAQATGLDLRKDGSPGSAYYAIKDARNTARSLERQVVTAEDKGSVAPPDWKVVLDRAVQALAEKTKDLEIVAYLIEALVRQAGFAGLRDGFRLARELVEKFWDGLYPSPDEDGVATRIAPLVGLNGDDSEGTLLAPIKGVPLTTVTSQGQFSYADYDQALALRKITDAKQRERRIASGAVPLETIEKAVAETPAEFYRNLMDDLTACATQYSQLCDALQQRCGNKPPPSSAIRGLLESCQDTIKIVAKKKLESLTPAAKPDAKPGKEADKTASDGEAAAGAERGALRTREDAFAALLDVAEFFRRTEPHTVISYTLEQIVRWGRMSLPELLSELIPEEAPRKNLFKQVGIRPPETPKGEAKK
jgi:type VI secretion system protein ImpA